MIDLKCPYCRDGIGELKDSLIVYGKSYGNIYLCSNYPLCDAMVGVHKNSNKPLGTLANKELRELRKLCHSLFDEMWKSRFYSRIACYKWLAKVMKVESKDAHIGQFNVEQCKILLEKLGGF